VVEEGDIEDYTLTIGWHLLRSRVKQISEMPQRIDHVVLQMLRDYT